MYYLEVAVMIPIINTSHAEQVFDFLALANHVVVVQVMSHACWRSKLAQ